MPDFLQRRASVGMIGAMCTRSRTGLTLNFARCAGVEGPSGGVRKREILPEGQS